MVKVTDPYQKIADMWTFPKSQSFRKMLEALMTREDAELLLEATTPVTAPELAKRLKVDEKVLSDKLDNLTKRGLIFRGKTQYHFHKSTRCNHPLWNCFQFRKETLEFNVGRSIPSEGSHSP